MRKKLTAVLFALTLPALAMAMPEGGPGPHPGGEHGPRLFKELDLTREQQRDVRKLMGEEMKSRHDITQRYLDKLPAAEKEAMKAELKASRDKQQTELRALLTPEQQKTFDAQQKKIKERHAEFEEFKAWKAQQAQKQ